MVFFKEFGELFLICIPLGIPAVDNADSEAVRINFLSHYSSPSNFLTSKITVMWLVLFKIA